MLGCFRRTLAFTCQQLFELMSWECPFLNRCRVTFSERDWENVLNLTMSRSLDMNRCMNMRGGAQTRDRSYEKGATTHLTRTD